jgi:hypothetical protein
VPLESDPPLESRRERAEACGLAWSYKRLMLRGGIDHEIETSLETLIGPEVSPLYASHQGAPVAGPNPTLPTSP